MKLAVMSDLHGDLPTVNPCDVICICGDLVPLELQRYYKYSVTWFKEVFFEWVLTQSCQKVILIGGNHDFFLDASKYSGVELLIKDSNVKDKLVYLENTAYTYDDVTFYGCPNVMGLPGWAFNVDESSDIYSLIPDCNILLTHQPPELDKIAYSEVYKSSWGSEKLLKAIKNRKIDYCFCGHVHEGDHHMIEFNNTKFQNVSLKNEDYEIVYPISYIDYERKDTFKGA